MSNRTLLFFIIIIIFFHIINTYFFDIKPQFFTDLNNKIRVVSLDLKQKIYFFKNYEYLSDYYQKINSENEQLKLKVSVLEEQNLYLLNQLNLSDFQASTNNFYLKPIYPVKYLEYGSFFKIALIKNNFAEHKIIGVVKNNFTAGITQNSILYLNHHKKTSYSVFIGLDKAPAIIHGENKLRMKAKFIPQWFEISNGDEVITSGLDNIFPFGIKVGRVINVKRANGYLTAEIKPYLTKNINFPYYLILKDKMN
jgi:rod shape-determining protein MreC